MIHQQEQLPLTQAFAAMPPGQRTTLPIHLLSRRRQTPVDKNGRTQRANLAPVTRDDTLQKGHIGGQIMASGGKLANAVRGSHQHHVAAIDARTGIDAPEAGRRAGGGIPDETRCGINRERSEEHTSELPTIMRISYAVFCLKKKTNIM